MCVLAPPRALAWSHKHVSRVLSSSRPSYSIGGRSQHLKLVIYFFRVLLSDAAASAAASAAVAGPMPRYRTHRNMLLSYRSLSFPILRLESQFHSLE